MPYEIPPDHIDTDQLHMALSYTVDEALNIVRERWTGDVTAQALTAHWSAMAADSAAMACRGSLADVTESAIGFPGEELQGLIRSIVIPALVGRGWKTAILVDRPVQFGVARQYSVFSTVANVSEVFTDPVLSEAWILR